MGYFETHHNYCVCVVCVRTQAHAHICLSNPFPDRRQQEKVSLGRVNKEDMEVDKVLPGLGTDGSSVHE